jgi:SAM-dependent methyltransferase
VQSADDSGPLTDAEHWDDYWARWGSALPLEIRRESGLQAAAILDVFDAWVGQAEIHSALEVGGAPGQYLAYVHRRTGCDCAVLDYSPTGCALSRENFRLLDIPLTVYEQDLFDERADIGTFDLVYSLGVIEHFDSLTPAVAAHVRLVRNGGLLVIGMPNLRGINRLFAKHIDRERLESHNLETMRVNRWQFEKHLGLERVFCGYVGGFEPWVFASTDKPRTLRSFPYRAVAHLLVRTVGQHFSTLRRLNHRGFSGYLMGVWRVSRA